MASGDHAEPSIFSDKASLELGEQWRRLTRSATLIAVLTSPAVFIWLYGKLDWPWGWALAGTFVTVILFRGLVDIIVRRFIPWPSLFGAGKSYLSEDTSLRRRIAFRVSCGGARAHQRADVGPRGRGRRAQPRPPPSRPRR